MKGFWIILAILGVTAAAWVAVGRLVEPSGDAPVAEPNANTRARESESRDASPEAMNPTPAPASQPARSPEAEPDGSIKSAAAGPSVPDSVPDRSVRPAADTPPDATATTTTPAAAPPLPAASAAAPAKSAEPPSSEPGEPFTLPANAAFPADKIVPAKAVKRADGTIVIDGRFVVKGQGTKDDPYRITWEHLISAQDVYKPKLGQKRLPERVTFLSGTYVRIAGYVAFPITSNNPRECLVMLNQWDGCCIGVPPTAYDAVEVKLAKPASGDDRMAVHGTLEGKLVVDPYEEGGWLLGLYLMEDGALKPDL